MTLPRITSYFMVCADLLDIMPTFVLLQDQLGDIVYAQPPEAEADISQDGKYMPQIQLTELQLYHAWQLL